MPLNLSSCLYISSQLWCVVFLPKFQLFTCVIFWHLRDVSFKNGGGSPIVRDVSSNTGVWGICFLIVIWPIISYVSSTDTQQHSRNGKIEWANGLLLRGLLKIYLIDGQSTIFCLWFSDTNLKWTPGNGQCGYLPPNCLHKAIIISLHHYLCTHWYSVHT